MKYKARSGAKFNNEEAQVIGDTINSLEVISPRNIVEEAKKEESPIHEFFEWEDTKAAEQYRLSQARDLTNHVIIVVECENEEIETRAFHSVVNNGERFYVTTIEAIENEDYRMQLLNQMITTLENLTINMKIFKEKL